MCSEFFHSRHKSFICLLFNLLVILFPLQGHTPTKPLNIPFTDNWEISFGWTKRKEASDALASTVFQLNHSARGQALPHPVQSGMAEASSGTVSAGPGCRGMTSFHCVRRIIEGLCYTHGMKSPERYGIEKAGGKDKETFGQGMGDRKMEKKGREESVFIVSGLAFWIWK